MEGVIMTRTRKTNKRSNGNKEFTIFLLAIAFICWLITCIPVDDTPECTYSKCDCYDFNTGYGFEFGIDYGFDYGLKHYHCDVHGHDCN